MRSGIRLGKLFDIDIRVDWSWLLIFLLVTWNLSSVLGQNHPDWSAMMRWGLGIFASLLFFASVLAHELAHSLVAKARGVNVRNITMFLFGGVSNIQRNPDKPGTEFLITVVGPITSLVLGGLLLAGGALLTGSVQTATNPEQIVQQLAPVPTLLLLLGSINIALGIFNLIPGFPLDGGRLLRSALWAITDDLRRATRWASWVGQGIAWLMIGSGIAMVFGVQVPFFGSGFIDGLWLAFIGWFLNSASASSYQQIVVQDMLEGVSVREMMRKEPPTVTPGTTVQALVEEHIMQSDDRNIPVIHGDKLVGLVAIDDVRGLPRDEWPNTPVRQIMTEVEQLETVSVDAEADDAFQKLSSRDVRQLPVMDGDKLVGLLRRRDLLRWLQLQSDLNMGNI